MPIGLGDTLARVEEDAVRGKLMQAFGTLSPCATDSGGGPCRYFRPKGFHGKIGFISAVSHRFCASCNRVRLTATGFFKTCLQYEHGVPLKPLLRGDPKRLKAAMRRAVAGKPDGHHFGGADTWTDERHNMNQIGG